MKVLIFKDADNLKTTFYYTEPRKKMYINKVRYSFQFQNFEMWLSLILRSINILIRWMCFHGCGAVSTFTAFLMYGSETF